MTVTDLTICSLNETDLQRNGPACTLEQRTYIVRYFRYKILPAAALLICAAFLPLTASAQSRDQRFPTPVTSNEINGTIPARDMGDSRQTSYFYAFEGVQGDIFINVVTKNLSGDIDVFTADSLQPLTKIVLYADSSSNETGRLIYLRKPARLILRVEGRTPNDDAATFKIKFAGSFVALAAKETEQAPVVDRSERDERSGIKVNSVGTIIEVVPKKVEKNETTQAEKEAAPIVESQAEPKTTESEPKPSEIDVPIKEVPKVVISPMPEATVISGDRSTRSDDAATETAPVKKDVKPAASTRKGRRTPPSTPSPESKEKAPDPLASIMLVIEMKDGGVVEHPMNEVVRFSVDKGVLTVVTKDGKTTRFSILNVERTTIQ